jgi:hypothetical protein
MNLLIIGFILVLAVVGILAVMYITKQASIPDCTNQDGSADGVSKFKLSDDKTACVIDTCASGYVLSTDQASCVSTDCSKMDGTAVFVKSYKFDSTAVACVPETCVDGSTLSNGACSAPPAPPPPPEFVQTAGNNTSLVVPTLKSIDDMYTATFGNQGPNYIVITRSDGVVMYGAGLGRATDPVVPVISGDGRLVFLTKDRGAFVWSANSRSHTTSDSYRLWMQPDGNLVLYAFNPSGGNTGPVWSSRNGE